MPGLLGKLLPVLILALLVAAANRLGLVGRHDGTAAAPTLAPSLRAPPDGIARAKYAAARAVELEALRTAVERFNTREGRPPESLIELTATGYLRENRMPKDLRSFDYDAATLSVVDSRR